MSKESGYEKAARMPIQSEEAMDLCFGGFQQSSGQARHIHQLSLKDARQIPSNSYRSRRQKYGLPTSPKLCSPHRRQLSSDDTALTLFLSPPSLSTNTLNSKPAARPPLRRKSSRKLPCRNRSRDATKTVPAGKELHMYLSEAEFLIQNQRHFTSEDFAAVLAAMAEESRIDEEMKQQEEESLLLAQELASEDLHKLEERKHSIIESEDVEALAVALRAELVEEDRKRQDEEESVRLAYQLVEEEARATGVLNCDDTSEFLNPCNNSICEDKPFSLQCQACLSDIESEDMLRELPSCGHHFHAYCINKWLLMNKKDCPFCRCVI
jgi:Ring finger domain